MRRFTRMYATREILHNALKTNAVNDNLVDAYEIALNDTPAKVHYEKSNDKSYDLILTHTVIPDQYQGHGLGTILAQRILDHLHDQKKKSKITCEFLYNFYEKNKEKYPFVVPNQ